MEKHTAAIYARYSSNNQREASIEDQLRICREYCEQNDLIVVREFTDHALTGRTDKRPGFLDMVRAGEKKSFKVLVVYAMDRLSRDRYDLAIYKYRLKKAGVRFVYVTQPLGETPEAALMEALLEGMAAYYSENLARSVRRGLEGNALKGIAATGSAPLGYTLTPDRHYKVDPVTAPIVKEIFEQYAEGVTRAKIVKSLNARGIKTMRGHDFKDNALCVILKNEIYIGVFHWADIRVENAVEPIIDKELFERVQSMLELNRSSKARGKGDADFLLTGKLFCAHCKALMVGDSGTSRAGSTYFYYTCTKRKRGSSCPTHSVRKDLIEPTILKACADALTDDAIAAVSAAAAEAARKEQEENNPLPALKKALSAIDSRISALISAIEQGIITPSTKQRLLDLEKEKSDLQTQIARAELDRPVITPAAFTAFLARYQGGDLNDPHYQKQLISAILNHALLEEQDGQKRLTLAFNLKTSVKIELPCSDDDSEVGLNGLEPSTFTMST